MERLKWPLIFVTLGLIAACSSDGTLSGNDVTGADMGPDYIQKTGLLHGEACTSNNECEYGICYNSPNITSSEFRICTKDCTKSEHDAACNIDNTDTVTYTCIKWGTYHPEEKLTGFCVPTCNTVDECKAIDSHYNACEMPGTGVYKVCRCKK